MQIRRCTPASSSSQRGRSHGEAEEEQLAGDQEVNTGVLG